MNRAEFGEVAGRMWDEIPPEARVGIEAVTIMDSDREHPEFPEVYTLGECVTDVWPTGYGDGDTRSELVLYYGSFMALAELDAAFDWADELWETILHELLHHREAAAGQSGLEDLDWAEEQNRRRWAGGGFDSEFYRAVPAGPDGVVRLDSELFIESSVGHGDPEAGFAWRGRSYTIRVPRDVSLAFVEVANLARGRVCVVVRRGRPWWRWWKGADEDAPPVELRRSALPVPSQMGD